MEYVKKLLEENLSQLDKQLEELSEIVDYQKAFNKDVQKEINRLAEEKKRIRDQQIAQAEEAFRVHCETIKARVLEQMGDRIPEYEERAKKAMPQYQETLSAIDEVKKALNAFSPLEFEPTPNDENE